MSPSNSGEKTLTFANLESFIEYYRVDLQEELFNFGVLEEQCLNEINRQIREQESEKCKIESKYEELKKLSSLFDQDCKVLNKKLDCIEAKIEKLENHVNLCKTCNCDQSRTFPYFLAEDINLRLMHINNLFGDDLSQTNNRVSSQAKLTGDVEKLVKSLKNLELQIDSLQKSCCQAEYYEHLVQKLNGL